MRPIDADKLAERIKASPAFRNLKGYWLESELLQAIVLELIQIAPTADVVEVVRCKDCKHYKRHKPPIEDFDGWCSANEIECDTDFYCQYGSMKGGK